MCPALLLVELLQAGRIDMGDEAQAESASASRGGLAASGDEHHRSAGRTAPRGDAHRAGPVFDGLPAHQWAEHGEDFVRFPAAGGHVNAEVVVLLAAVPDAERIGHPPPADQVQHGHFLGKPHGFPQRNGHRGQQDCQRARPGGYRRGQHQRRGQMAVVGAVVVGFARPPQLGRTKL